MLSVFFTTIDSEHRWLSFTALGQLILLAYMAVCRYELSEEYIGLLPVFEWIITLCLLLALISATVISLRKGSCGPIIFAVLLNVGIAILSYIIAPYVIWGIIFGVVLMSLFSLLALAASGGIIAAFAAGSLLSIIGVPALFVLLAILSVVTKL